MTASNSNNNKIFYGWIVVLAGLLIMVTVGGVAWNCVGLFIKPVCEDLGFTRQAMSANSTITSLVGMAISLSWGYILKNFSLRKLMRLAVFGLPLGYLGYSISTNIWMFYGFSVLVGFSLCFLMNLPLSMIIGNWFEEKRGLAFGIAFMGSGLGGMIASPLVASLLESLSWRMTYRLSAAAMFVVSFIAVFFLIRIRPEEMGLKALGSEKLDAAAADGHPVSEEGEMLSDLRVTARFWIIVLALSIGNSAMGTINQALQPHLTDNGYDLQTAAWIYSIGMGALAIGKILLGGIYDRLGMRRATLLAMVCGFLGVWGMINCHSIPALGVTVILGQGLGCAMGTVGIPLIVQGFFGKKDYPAVFGFYSALGSAVNAASPMLNGMAYDIWGSYNPAFTCWLIGLGIAIVVFFLLLPRQNKSESKKA